MIKTTIMAAALLIGGTAFAQYPGAPEYPQNPSPNYNPNPNYPNYGGDPNYQQGPYNTAPYDNSGQYPPQYGGPYDQGQYGYPAPAPPPAPAYAYQPPAPGPGYIWIGGYWNFLGGRYVWTNGYWGLPHAGSYWVAPRYYGGRFYAGHWGGPSYVVRGGFHNDFRGVEHGRSNLRGGEHRR